YTLHDGAFSAWVVDTLRERNHADRVGIILSRSYGHMALAQAIGAFIALPLYLSGYVFYAFSLGFTSCILCAVFCSIMMRENKDIAFHEGPLVWKHSLDRMKSLTIEGLKISFKVPAVGYLVLMYVAFMFLTHVVSYLWPVAMKANFGVGRMSSYWYAIVGLSLFLNFLGAKAMELIAHKSPSNVALWIWFMLISLVMSSPVAYLGIKTMEGDVSLVLLVLSVVLCRFGYGFLRPCYDMLVNKYISAEHSKRRATILSLGGTLSSLVVVLLMIPSSGTTGENTTFGWLIPSGLLIVLTLVLGFLMRRYQRRIGELPS
ncbi:MAG: hypothetical protein Q8P84_00935, partial [Deltaproteobacteria bacterium]|nr:hypothetical protein [Deltaproteobacteria bacterium]